MERTVVESTNLASVGFDRGTSTLEIEFRGGSIYQYFDVPEMVYEDLMRAGSKGRCFHETIRDVFRYVRL